MENFTKENFFNQMTEKYPIAMKDFCEWIDKYKVDNNWIELFNQGVTSHTVTPKFHDLPMAMQAGIIAYYLAQHEGGTDDEILSDVKDGIIEEFKALDKRLYIDKYPQYAGSSTKV